VLQAAERRFFGHTDVPLSPAGLLQVAALARALGAEAIEAVYASDLARARESAAPLAVARGVDVAALASLREAAMGRWEGLTFAEIQAREPELSARWLADPVDVAFPGGESLRDLRARIAPALRELVARHAGRRIAVVAHGGTNRVILGEALGLPLAAALRLPQDYAAWSLVEYRADGAVLHTLNRRPTGVPVARPAGTILPQAGSR
jgi:broad specificity phosphatase PhoE